MRNNPSIISCLAAHPHDTDSYYEAIANCAGPDYMFWDAPLSAWISTGYEDCVGLLHDTRLERTRPCLSGNSESTDLMDFAQRIMDSQMMFSDDPAASGYRRDWSQSLSGQSSSGPTLKQLAAKTLEEAADGIERDAFKEILEPFVSRSICSRLGVKETERRALYRYILQYVNLLDGRTTNKDDFQLSLFALVSLYSKLSSRADPQLLREDRHRWISNLVLVLAAGHESTAYVLGTVLLRWAKPHTSTSAHLQRLRQVVTEAIRYDNPVQMIGRRATSELEVNKHRISKGDRVYLHIGAANRDPRMFAEASEFNPERSGPPPLSFGVGRSQCIGRSLAMDAAITFLSTMIESNVSLKIDRSGVRWNNGLSGRAFSVLPATVHSSTSIQTRYQAALC